MKQNKPLLANILALLIILVVGLGISNMMKKYFQSGNEIFLIPNTAFSEVNHQSTLQEDEYKEDDIFYNFDSEQFVEAILEDLNLSEEGSISKPRLALIIDDLGYEREIAKKIIEFDFPIALSILPFLKCSEEIAQEGKNNNQEIMLHLPLEANDPNNNPGLGAIKTGMLEEEIRQAVREAIFNFPHVIGVNNHMGSKITENRKIMEIILQEIKRYNLFFVDSLTSSNSIAYRIAQEMGVKTAVRSVFLDNENGLDYIKDQILEARKIAWRNGEAIAIGHSRINTYYALSRFIPELIKEGIEIVPVSQLVK